jgi:hypothetical protein
VCYFYEKKQPKFTEPDPILNNSLPANVNFSAKKNIIIRIQTNPSQPNS